ncbi:hypothetical protein LR48_Vigan02g262300 [Vigna angularis]|uniref:Early nodulin-75-like n=2 Tax=Phaseolus angularis TaxID=3914 RepID=A0A0S3S979_PHAAN|nr:early nodulin-75 [Vigna angularis]XP_017413254.1 early nodulin-75 [Vigna angularis]BAT89344.1 hypothetical protein VIGAN_06027700 [Vigna angularis var. angularis]KAG2396581.1 uncharacterized protein HKW66_Vig0228560 [Vigna angularis]KAG2396583.1 uncharacterized protein HKW66_Vig0228580 [Vigna angularis]KOM36472.1 hypothetical protein LR48_Vigan02g262200 [Vigna angularis]KOM36473.1 hypothetical protein LR48_Vigan02g262300 [Vigna angularis]
MSPKHMLVFLLPFLLVASSLSILPSSSPANNDAKPQPHTPKPPHHNKPSPHIENGHPKPPHHGKPPPDMEDASHKGKPPHIPPRHGKPPPIGTTKELPPKEQQSTKNPHPRPGHGGHNVESTNFRPIDPPGSD